MLKPTTYIKQFASIFLLCVILHSLSFSQKKDSTKVLINSDSTFSVKPKHNPKLATKRSLILPGWGQAYNREYWKIPLVYGALSIPTITFIYNNNVYKEAKYAYEARFKAAQTGATHADSANYLSLEYKYQRADINAIQLLRNAARRDRDYSALWFLIVWGLNVADATVFGHLKDFDVSNNLAINIRPHFNSSTFIPGVNLSLRIKEKKKTLTEIR